MIEEIDTTIQSVERLYRAVSGRDANGAESTPFPPEKDAGKHVEDQIDRLLGVLTLVPAATAPATSAAPKGPSAWAPAIALLEQGDEVVVRIDLPGVARDHVQVTASAAAIVVSGR